MDVELSDDAKSDVEMGVRDEIVSRLRQLPEVLGKTDGEIVRTLGITVPQWANYKAEKIQVTIRPMVALELEKAFGVPMSWVYGGLLDRVADPSLRAKLTIANRKAEAWLASRRPTK